MYQPVDESSARTLTYSFEYEGIAVNTHYAFSVAAINVEGTGVFSSLPFFTNEGKINVHICYLTLDLFVEWQKSENIKHCNKLDKSGNDMYNVLPH